MIIRERIQRLLLAALLLLNVSPGQAQDDDLCAPFMDGKVSESLLATMLSAAENGDLYRIRTESSRVGFCVGSQLAEIKGIFREFQGGLTLGDDTGNGQTMVIIRADSIDTKGKLTESIVKGENFFDTENNPEILFVSHGFEWTSRDTAEIKGDLTLRGITKPVVFHVQLTAMDGKQDHEFKRILVKATAELSRSEFGMNAFSSLVDDSVRLCMSIEAMKYRS
ncbi:MAG: YceI family protein [Gammaproteobacteria bacterium]